MKNPNAAGGAKKSSGHLNDLEHTKSVVERIVNASMDITGEYNEWVSIGFALAGFGEEGRSLFHDVSRLSPKYDQADCDAKFTNCLRSAQQRLEGNGGSETAVTIATFMKIAQDHGIDISLPKELKGKRGRPKKEGSEEDKTPAAKKVIDTMQSIYELRYNVVLSDVQYKYKSDEEGGEWKRLNDREVDTFYTSLRTDGINVRKNDVWTFFNSETYAPDFNPFVEYFSSLPEWDQKTDYVEQLFDNIQFETPEDRNFCMPKLKKWFYNAVGQMAGMTQENQTVPVLMGDQHVGKTHFCKNIMPPVLREYVDTLLPGDKLEKDTLIGMSECGMIILEEFELDKSTSNKMKAIVSIRDYSFRAAYAHTRKCYHRLASFIANSNDNVYIDNPEGDRRYLTVCVKGTTNPLCMPYEGAYAQAYWVVCNLGPESYLITPEESAAISEKNRNHTHVDFCESVIQLRFRKPLEGEDGMMLSSAEIYSYLSYFRSPELTINNIGKAMKRLQFNSKKTHGTVKYHVVKVTEKTDEQLKAEGAAFRCEMQEAHAAQQKQAEEQQKAELDALQGRLDFEQRECQF